jgi:hypothetical protein
MHARLMQVASVKDCRMQGDIIVGDHEGPTVVSSNSVTIFSVSCGSYAG